MSWITRIKDIELTIITGDGKEYRPLWKEAKKNINFNTEAFDFIDIRGTYIERGQMQGRQFPILLYFTGDNNIDVATEFEISSRDNRPWTIKHPYYDDLTVQPLNLEFDNSLHNVTRINGILWETLTAKYPDDTINPEKEVIIRKQQSDDNIEETFVNNIQTPSAESISTASDSVSIIGSNYETITESSEDISNLKDIIRSASAAAQELISLPDRYIQETISLINFPFSIEQDISQKISAMLNNLDSLISIFLDDPTDDNKLMYEMQSSIMFTEISRNIMQSDETDYNIRSNVIEVIDIINGSYESFLENMDNNEIDQDKQVSKDLDYIINLALAKLYDIAFEAKQERTFILDKDDNIINLAHRFLGPGDNNIELFINQNSIRQNEYLGLKKGRKINYYV